MSKLTKAEKILELHLGSEFYRFKESEWYFNIKNAMNEAINYTRCSLQLKDKEVKCFDDFLEIYCEQKENNKWLYRDSIWSYDYIIQTYKELYKNL